MFIHKDTERQTGDPVWRIKYSIQIVLAKTNTHQKLFQLKSVLVYIAW